MKDAVVNPEFFDGLEARDPAAREAALMAALPVQVRRAQATPAGAEKLHVVDAASICTRAALAGLPVTRKPELLARQIAHRGTDSLGGFSTLGWHAQQHQHVLRPARRVYQSPGPIYEPEGPDTDHWRAARALFAAGFRAGDLVHNSFSYHLTPGAWLMESGAHALGCTVFPGGVGQTELQLQAMHDLRPDAYTGTPSFLRILLEKAAETGQPLPSLKKALLSGEAFPPSLRDWLLAREVNAFGAYATAELGVVAFETSARQGLVVDEGVILEIVRPGTDDPVPDGEVGEVVVTTFNADYPLLRFGTGDLSAVLPGTCPTGRSNVRIKGWLGRADQTAKVRGMFVHPGQVAAVIKNQPGVHRARLVVSGEMAHDELALHVESSLSDSAAAALANALARSLREVTKLRGEVHVVAPGSLPNDGKVIDDLRSYQ